jgi:ATP-binding cassette subfamily B protein
LGCRPSGEAKYTLLIHICSVFRGNQLANPIGYPNNCRLRYGGSFKHKLVFLSVLITGTVLLAGLTRLAQISIIDSIQRKLFLHFGTIFKDRIRVLKRKGQKMTEQLELRTSYFYDVVTLQKSLSKLLVDFTGKLLQALFGVLLLAIYHPLFIAFGIALIIRCVYRFAFHMEERI